MTFGAKVSRLAISKTGGVVGERPKLRHISYQEVPKGRRKNLAFPGLQPLKRFPFAKLRRAGKFNSMRFVTLGKWSEI
jgi:hypothetical protein